MGYVGKLELKIKARKMRKHGVSIREIQKQLAVSKSSVTLWTRDIKLTQKQLKKLYLNKKTGGLKGSIIASMNKIKRREILTKKIMKEARKEVRRLTKKEKFIVGIAMYFAEGSKGDKNVCFTNSDYKAIKFMTDWLRNFCGVPSSRFRCSLYIHDNLDETKAKEYWSSLTDIPLSQFTKSYIVKNNLKRFRKSKHEYGVCRITVSDVNLHRKIMGWISGVFGV